MKLERYLNRIKPMQAALEAGDGRPPKISVSEWQQRLSDVVIAAKEYRDNYQPQEDDSWERTDFLYDVRRVISNEFWLLEQARVNFTEREFAETQSEMNRLGEMFETYLKQYFTEGWEDDEADGVDEEEPEDTSPDMHQLYSSMASTDEEYQLPK